MDGAGGGKRRAGGTEVEIRGLEKIAGSFAGLGMVVIILGIVMIGLWAIGRWDRALPLSCRGYFGICAAAAAEGSAALRLTAGEPMINRLLLAVIGGCLLLACVTDLVTCQVYNFTWWPGLASSLVLLWYAWFVSGTASLETVKSFLFFLTLQLMLFCRVYGRADCYAFCVCAAAEASRGFQAAGYLVHMLVAYALLFLVQTVRGNINRKGNLKEPVPFLPYITISFWIVAAAGRSG